MYIICLAIFRLPLLKRDISSYFETIACLDIRQTCESLSKLWVIVSDRSSEYGDKRHKLRSYAP